jgi:hypothetical protein
VVQEQLLGADILLGDGVGDVVAKQFRVIGAGRIGNALKRGKVLFLQRGKLLFHEFQFSASALLAPR